MMRFLTLAALFLTASSSTASVRYTQGKASMIPRRCRTQSLRLAP
jgi:hypothetical protein